MENKPPISICYPEKDETKQCKPEESNEWRYLLAQALLVQRGIGLNVQVGSDLPSEGDQLSKTNLNSKLKALPKVLQGRQDIFIHTPKYEDQELEYRLLHLKAFLITKGYESYCGHIKPQFGVPLDIVQSTQASCDLQFVHEIYKTLKTSKEAPNDTMKTPEEMYNDIKQHYSDAKMF